MTQITLDHYGLHFDANGIAWLMQGRGSTNAIGLKEKPPFDVRLPGGHRHCNHQVPTAAPVPHDRHWQFLAQHIDDPMVQAALPVPKDRNDLAVFVDDPANALETHLTLLSKLSSPIYKAVIRIDDMPAEDLDAELQQTNLQPLLLTGCKPEHHDRITAIASAASSQPRKVLFQGEAPTRLPDGVQRISETALRGTLPLQDLIALPWENLGAGLIRRYMRGEWPIRRNETCARPDKHSQHAA